MYSEVNSYSRGKQINSNSICVVITLICNLGILYGNPLKDTLIVSVSTRVLIISIVLIGLLRGLNIFLGTSYDTNNKKAIILLLFFTTVFFPAFSGLSTAFRQYVPILCYLLVPSYFIIYGDTSIGYKQRKLIYYFNLIYIVLFYRLTRSEYAFIGYTNWGTYTSDVLTLGYTNPNETGMMLLVPLLIAEIAFIESKRILERSLFGAVSGYVLYLLVMNDSRTCVILGFAFTILLLFKLYKKINESIIKWILLAPFIIMVLQAIISVDVLGSIKILNEAIGPSRKFMIISFFSSASVLNYIVGSFSSYAGANLHNSYLSIIAMYGFVGLIIYLAFLKMYLSDFFARSKASGNEISLISTFAIMIILLHGCTEAAYLVSGSVYGGLFGLLIMLASSRDEEEYL